MVVARARARTSARASFARIKSCGTGRGKSRFAQCICITPLPCLCFPPAGKFTAADVFDDFTKLAALKAKAAVVLEGVDCLLVPTVLEHYLIEEINSGEIVSVFEGLILV
jgi:hypothetical protein